MSLFIPALQRSYPDNDGFVLDTPEIQLAKEGFTCLIGRNGSGKSSFGEALAQISSDTPWFYLPQFIDRFLYAENLSEQLNTFLTGLVDRDRIVSLMHELGFENAQSMVEFPFILMSGGERRRAALAAVFYMEPQQIVLDEPEIGITAKENMVLLTKIRNLKAIDTRVILISHNYDFVKESTSLICLENGSLKRAGKTNEILADPGFDIEEFGVRSGSHR